MRLINADALKKDIDTEWLTPQTKMAFFKIIDNAPTVEQNKPTLNESIAFNNGYELGKSERPQGEWIKVKEERMSIDMSGEIVTRYKCSKCERVIATFPSKLADYYPFCHCGADMQKGGAE